MIILKKRRNVTTLAMTKWKTPIWTSPTTGCAKKKPCILTYKYNMACSEVGNSEEKHPPGNEVSAWHVTEGVDHGDHKRDDNNDGVYNVQLGAEVHTETKGDQEGIIKITTLHETGHKTYTDRSETGWIYWATLSLHSAVRAQHMEYISCTASSSWLPVQQLISPTFCWQKGLGMFA